DDQRVRSHPNRTATLRAGPARVKAYASAPDGGSPEPNGPFGRGPCRRTAYHATFNGLYGRRALSIPTGADVPMRAFIPWRCALVLIGAALVAAALRPESPVPDSDTTLARRFVHEASRLIGTTGNGGAAARLAESLLEA